MKLDNEQQVRSTQEKIAGLEAEYERVKRGDTEANETAQQLILASLRRTINQMKEDIVRYRSGAQSQAVKQR